MKIYTSIYSAYPSGSAFSRASQQAIACWDYGFESRRGGAWTSVSCKCRVLTGREVFVSGLIPCPEESYRLWCVIAKPQQWWSQGTSTAVSTQEYMCVYTYIDCQKLPTFHSGITKWYGETNYKNMDGSCHNLAMASSQWFTTNISHNTAWPDRCSIQEILKQIRRL